MTGQDVVTSKLGTIDRCLRRIAETRDERRTALLPVEVEDITVINLQRAIRAAIDLALHTVRSEGSEIPEPAADSFTLLGQQGIIDRDLAARLRRMAVFRNITLYDHQSVGPDVIEAVLDRHLGDLRAFGDRMEERLHSAQLKEQARLRELRGKVVWEGDLEESRLSRILDDHH